MRVETGVSSRTALRVEARRLLLLLPPMEERLGVLRFLPDRLPALSASCMRNHVVRRAASNKRCRLTSRLLSAADVGRMNDGKATASLLSPTATPAAAEAAAIVAGLAALPSCVALLRASALIAAELLMTGALLDAAAAAAVFAEDFDLGLSDTERVAGLSVFALADAADDEEDVPLVERALTLLLVAAGLIELLLPPLTLAAREAGLLLAAADLDFTDDRVVGAETATADEEAADLRRSATGCDFFTAGVELFLALLGFGFSADAANVTCAEASSSADACAAAPADEEESELASMAESAAGAASGSEAGSTAMAALEEAEEDEDEDEEASAAGACAMSTSESASATADSAGFCEQLQSDSNATLWPTCAEASTSGTAGALSS